MSGEPEIGDDVLLSIPPNEERCVRNGGRGWRCKERKLENFKYCPKHYYMQFIKKSAVMPIIEKEDAEVVGEMEEKGLFTKGQKVEVTDDDEGLRDAWFTAKIIEISPTRAGKILVEYDTLFVDEEGSNRLREAVGLSMVRPSPPSLPTHSFQQSQIVDAFINDGWWKGKISCVYKNLTCMVYFPIWNERQKFEVEQLRVHQEWVNGRWVCPHEIVYNVGETEHGQQSQIGETAEIIDSANESCKRKMKTEQISPRPSKQKKSTSPNTTKIFSDTLRTSRDHLTPSSSQQKSAYNLRACRNSSLSPLSEVGALGGPSTTQSPTHDKTKRNCIVLNQQNEEVETRQSKEMGSEEDPQYRTPCREVTTGVQTDCPPQGTELTVIEDAPPLSADPYSHSGSLLHYTNPQYKTPCREVTNGVQTDCALKDTDLPTIEDATPLSGESYSLTVSLPFKKSFTLWGDLEKTSVLRKMRQNPHFSLLSETNEFLREGEAIGYMLSFVSIAEKVSNLKHNEANITTLEDYLEILKDFEAMGFDVESIRARLNKLRTVRIRLEELEDELTQVKEKMIKEKVEEESLKCKCEENNEKVRGIAEAIVELKEKREKLVMEKQGKYSGIIAMRKMLQETEKEICEVEVKFCHAAARPW